MHLPPTPPQKHPLFCSLSFLKNPVCEFFLAVAELCRKYLILLCFRVTAPVSPCPQMHCTEYYKRGEWGRALYTSWWAVVSSPKKKNQCFEILLWSGKPFVLYIGKKAVVVHKPCFTQRPLSSPKAPSAMLCVSHYGHNLSSPTPVKTRTHSAVYLWDFMVLRDTDSFRNAG